MLIIFVIDEFQWNMYITYEYKVRLGVTCSEHAEYDDKM